MSSEELELINSFTNKKEKIMKSTFTILFYLRKNKVNENGEAPIMSRITINGEKV